MKKGELKSLEKLSQNAESIEILANAMNTDILPKVREMKETLNETERQIHLFCDRFSDRGWCIYDDLKFEVVRKANESFENTGIADAENVLIDFYTGDAKNYIQWIINSSTAFSVRKPMIEHFWKQHFEKNYFSSIPLALIIIDGAVNDYTKSKGFFAEGTDVDAWDCLVGCSDALVKMQKIFTKSRTKTNTSIITMPYRNGILHGRDLNYANDHVACKCLALMFAVSNWMKMKDSEEKRKEKFEKENNPPPLNESLRRLQEIKRDRKKIQQWKKSEIIIGKNIPSSGDLTQFNNYPYIIPLIEMLDYWKTKNYGKLSQKLSMMFASYPTPKKQAGACRDLFEDKELLTYSITSVAEEGCAMSCLQVYVEWKTNNQTFYGNLVFGSSYIGEELLVVPWKNNGEWTLFPRDVKDIYNPKQKNFEKDDL